MKELIKIFKQNNGYLSSKELNSRNLQNKLKKMMEDGSVSKIKRGVYCLNEEISKRQIIDVDRIIPNGVLCLYSAWNYYHLSLSIPDAFYIAIEKSRKIVVPKFPLVKIIYLKKEYFEMGIIETEVEGIKTKIYDIEKSVCDAVKYRNKIGMEITTEIIRNYLNTKTRNIDKLVQYAKLMRIYTTLKMYIEVQL